MSGFEHKLHHPLQKNFPVEGDREEVGTAENALNNMLRLIRNVSNKKLGSPPPVETVSPPSTENVYNLFEDLDDALLESITRHHECT